MEANFLAAVVVILVGVVVLGLLAAGAVLMVRDTVRRRGNWGINLGPAACTKCGTAAPLVRKPANWRQAMWGGWTCAPCGLELDKWGRPVEGQQGPAKWKVLRSVEDAERRPHTSEERIREANDQTQRGKTT